MNQRNLSSLLRQRTTGLANAAARVAARLGLSPNQISILGLLPVAIGAYLVGNGLWGLAAFIFIIGAPLDMLDGALARLSNRVSNFGALLDSALDRYADGLMLGAAAYYFARAGQPEGVFWALAALIGAFSVSYVRARAEGLGIGSIRAGLFDRPIRIIIFIAALLLSALLGSANGLLLGLVVLAIGSNLTAAQRLWLAASQP
jgi:CDP-diacylglycerol---glycerol-3-phosphate 3-phosphatidyltransferase